MLSKAEIQDCKARLNRLGITDEAQVKAVLDFCRSIALIAIEKYEEELFKNNIMIVVFISIGRNNYIEWKNYI